MKSPRATSVQNLQKVLAVNGKINSSLDLDELLGIIMTTASEVMRTEAASLMLLDKKTNDLEFRVALGCKASNLKESFRIKMGEGIAGAVAKSGKSIVVNDVRKDKRFAGRFDKSTGFVTKAILCVPMHVQGKITGVLEAINPRHPFSQNDLHLFEIFADQAAIAAENARLHGELVSQERAKQELKIAHEIQQNFLPDFTQNSFPVEIAAQNIPARDVGGDFYDAVRIDSSKTGIIIGDVSGKGVPAALYMVRAISEYRYLSLRFTDPSEVLTKLNDVLARDNRFAMFVTLLYGVLDHERQTLTLASAGHPPVLRKNAKTGKLEALENAGGIPVGMMEGSEYSQVEIPVSAGDVLFLYTDGVTEARDQKGKEYTGEGLKLSAAKKCATAREYAEQLLEDLKIFTRGAEPHDDITVIAVKI